MALSLSNSGLGLCTWAFSRVSFRRSSASCFSLALLSDGAKKRLVDVMAHGEAFLARW